MSQFVWFQGSTGASGLLQPTINLLTKEIVGVSNGNGCTSTIGGNAGIFTCATGTGNTSGAIWSDVWLNVGNPGIGSNSTALSAGANFSGWILASPDGVNFESPSNATATTGPARAPDFIIPMPASAIGFNTYWKSQGVSAVKLPPFPFKIFLKNNTGISFGNAAVTPPALICAPAAIATLL